MKIFNREKRSQYDRLSYMAPYLKDFRVDLKSRGRKL